MEEKMAMTKRYTLIVFNKSIRRAKNVTTDTSL